jgi:DNA polymerase-3 subunit epsilon
MNVVRHRAYGWIARSLENESEMSGSREIVLDTETTGLDPLAGHRIIEIGAIELINHVPTGGTFHKYLNPDMAIDAEATAVHGITNERLANEPRFGEVIDELLSFLGDARLIIHNADFDVGFLNAEFVRLGFPPLPSTRATCTVKLARRKYPGSPASLDALCRRFAIDNSARTLHGALLDAQLLAECYLEMMGGRQPTLVLAAERAAQAKATTITFVARPPRPHAPSAEELVAHAALLATLKDPVWLT